MDDLGFENEEPEKINVAVTTMAFDNAQLINLLRTRGTYIRTEKWDKMREVDTKINELKQANLEKFTRPCSVFMTFEGEEGYQRALKYHDTNLVADADQVFLGDQRIEIQAASEPSDIIWENRHFTPAQRLKKTIVVVSIIAFALFCSFMVIFWGRKYQKQVAQKFPPVDCDPFYETYQD